jgi:hypothetical protein
MVCLVLTIPMFFLLKYVNTRKPLRILTETLIG